MIERANEDLLQKVGDVLVRSQRRAQSAIYVGGMLIVEDGGRAGVAGAQCLNQRGLVTDERQGREHFAKIFH